MTIDTTSATPMSGPRKGHTGLNVLAGAIATGAFLTASVGLWAYNSQDTRTIPQAPAVEVAKPALPPVTFTSTFGRSTPYTLYIVSSEERAAAVRAGLEDANVVRAAANEAPLQVGNDLTRGLIRF